MKPLLLRDGEDEDRRYWRIQLLGNRLCFFAPSAMLELLGWWVHNDPSLLERKYESVIPGEEARSMSEFMSDFAEHLFLIMNETKDLAYIEPIVNDLLAGNVPGRPSRRKSLLYGPLFDANRRCGLPGCCRTRHAEGGDLLRCTGGCRVSNSIAAKSTRLKTGADTRHFAKPTSRLDSIERIRRITEFPFNNLQRSRKSRKITVSKLWA